MISANIKNISDEITCLIYANDISSPFITLKDAVLLRSVLAYIKSTNKEFIACPIGDNKKNGDKVRSLRKVFWFQ